MKTHQARKHTVVILGAGLSGLSAACQLLSSGTAGSDILVIEQEDIPGGLAQTRTHKDFTFDLGPHRWFTKNEDIDMLWEQINSPDVLNIARLTRIWYRQKLFRYPLVISDIVHNIGFMAASGYLSGYLRQVVKNMLSHSAPANLEEAFVQRFGQPLYQAFFKEYNEKLWGAGGCNALASDWASQRVKDLSLAETIIDAIGIKRKKTVTSLIDCFKYPLEGAGHTSTRLARTLTSAGGTITYNSTITGITHGESGVTSIRYSSGTDETVVPTDHCISSIPVSQLASMIEPHLDKNITNAANALEYRAIIFVVLFINQPRIIQDNWIYVQDATICFNRFMDMASWNPNLSPKGSTSLIFEVTCAFGDSCWNADDEELIRTVSGQFLNSFATPAGTKILGGAVYRKSHAYPIYRLGYREHLQTVKNSLKKLTNLQLIGRNGLFRYNNMDHAMASGIAAARNYHGATVDIDAINLDSTYHEEKTEV